jgi:hypothetical protein
LGFEELLKIALIVASVLQFFLSFIKGRSINKDCGDKLFVLNIGYAKRRFLALLFIGLIAYFIYVIITGYFTMLGIFIVVYFLLSIYDFSKLKIITSTGIGQKSFYSNSYYNFTDWSSIVEWNWSKDKENLLIFKIRKNEKIQTKDWMVSNSEREAINELFEKYTGKI